MKQMNVFKFNYTIKGTEKQYDVTIVAETKEKGISLIIRKNNNVAIRVNSMSSIGMVHAIDDEIVDRFSQADGKLEKYKEKIANQNRMLEDYEHQLSEYQQRMDELNRQPSSKDLADAIKGKNGGEKVYVCPECGFESKTVQGIKIHNKKAHQDKQPVAGEGDGSPIENQDK